MITIINIIIIIIDINCTESGSPLSLYYNNI